MELLFPVSSGEFVLYFPKYSSIFSQDKTLVWAVSYVIVSSFFCIIPQPEVREQLGRKQESGRFPSGWQYVKEIADRQTKGWEWTSNIANVYQYPAPFHDQWVSLQKYVNMKAIFAVMNTNWAVVKIMPKKKNQACTGFEPMTSAVPVLRSTNWANKLNGR